MVSFTLPKANSVVALDLMGDTDDIANAILTSTLLGYPVDPIPMIEQFESSSCFLTFHGERKPSFSVNCIILS